MCSSYTKFERFSLQIFRFFPARAANKRPVIPYSDFRFKTYAPLAFRFFRRLFEIPPDLFLVRWEKVKFSGFYSNVTAPAGPTGLSRKSADPSPPKVGQNFKNFTMGKIENLRNFFCTEDLFCKKVDFWVTWSILRTPPPPQKSAGPLAWGGGGQPPQKSLGFYLKNLLCSRLVYVVNI